MIPMKSFTNYTSYYFKTLIYFFIKIDLPIGGETYLIIQVIVSKFCIKKWKKIVLTFSRKIYLFVFLLVFYLLLIV